MPWGNKTFQLIVALASIACGLVCCWLMVESISLTFEDISIPKWLLWIFAWWVWSLMLICLNGFLGSLNTYICIERRLLKLIFGFVVLLLLWFGLMLPMNAHVLLYKQMAKSTALKELKHIDVELEELTSVEKFIQTYQTEWDAYVQNVSAVLLQLQNEIRDFQNPGTGVRPISIIDELENALRVEHGTLTRIKPQKNSQKELLKVYEYYNNAAKEQLALKHQDYEKQLGVAIIDFQERMKNVAPLRRDIKTTLDQLDDDQYDKEAVLKNARKVISKSYAELESQYNGIYTYDENVYRSDRLVKVTKVWGDYFKGKFKNTDYTLWYWILLSIIIEMISLFIFLPRKIDEYLKEKYRQRYYYSLYIY